MTNIPALATIKDAAKLLNVSTKTLRRWEARGVLVPIRTDGGHRRYEIAKIRELKGNKRHIRMSTTFQPVTPEVQTLPEIPVLYESLHIDQRKFLKTALKFAIFILMVYSGVKLTPVKARDFVKSRILRQKIATDNVTPNQGAVLAANTSNVTPTFNINIQSAFKDNSLFTKDVEIDGDLTLKKQIIGNVDLTGVVIVGGNSITTHQSTFNLINDTATTLNIGGAATALSLGATTGITTVNNDLNVEGDAEITGAALVGGNLTTSGDLSVAGSTALGGAETVAGKITGSSDLSISGDALFGNITSINGVTYSFPTTQGGSSTLLTNDGSGTLTWTTPTLGSFGGILPIANGGTNNAGPYPAGSVIFSDGTKLTEDNANFFWDDATNRLGIGNAAPGVALDVTGAGTFSSTLTASNGLTLTTGALNLTSTSGTANLTSTATSGDSFAFTNNALSSAGSNLVNLTFQNANTGAGVVTNGLNINASGSTPSSLTNTENLINLGATALGSNTFTGINFGSGLSNYVSSTNWTVTAAGAETIASDLGVNGGNITTTQTTANIFTGATTLGIGNVAGTTTINGGLTAIGATNLNGDITLGNAITDNISFTGRVAQDSDLVPITTTGTNDLGSALLPWDNVYANAFIQNGNNVCDSSGANCPAGSTSFWDQALGAIYPISNSVDLLVGASSTGSAKFAFTGVNGGLPTASIAGNIANVATYLTGNGNLGTTNAQDLALGSATTGNVVLNSRGIAALTANGANLTTPGTISLPNSNTLTGVSNYLQTSQGFSVGGNTTYFFDGSGNLNANTGTFAGDVAVNGGDLTTTQTTANLFTNASTLGIGAGSGTTTINNAVAAITGTLTANGNTVLGDAITDTITFTGRVAQDSDLLPIGTTGTNDLGSALLPWDNVHANAFIQNGNAVCDASGANCPTAGSGGSKWRLTNGAISPFSDSLDVLIGSSATTSAKFAFSNVLTGTPTASIAGSIANVATYLTGNGSLSTTNAQDLTLGSATTGNVVLNSRGLAALTANGANLTATGTLALPNSNTVTGVANYLQASQGYSVGGGTTYYFDSSGNLNANSGTFAGNINANGDSTLGNAITDTISFTGRVAPDSDLLPIGTTGTNDLGSALLPWDNVYANAFIQNGNTVCDSSGANCPAGATQYWGQVNGAIYTLSNSADVLIGSSATGSAKFAFTGVNSGIPTASVSGTYLTANGTLATTSNQHLTLGGATTGQVDVNNNLNVSTGNGYLINNASVLNATTLGSTVVNSSLTGVGALSSGSIATGFGTIATANTITGTTLNGTTGVNTGAVGGTQRIDSSGNLLNINNITAGGTVNLASLTANKVVFTDGSKNLTSTGTVGADQGGTGLSSYAVGDLLYADTTSTLGKLADVATGNVLLSGGVNTAPSWGKVALGTHTTGNYVSTLAGTANQITTSGSTGDITLTIPSDFRAPGTVNAVSGIYTGAGAGTIRIDGSGNITATDLSSSGNTTLGDAITDTLTFTGRVAQDADLIPIGTTGTNDLGSASLPWDNIYGVAFTQNGNSVCDTSGNCASVGNYWGQANGALYPANNSVDLLLGSTATSSAKFAFTGVTSGIPTASIAGNIANVATYLTGNGNLSTTNARDLTLGGTTTGNVVLNSRGSAALTANGANLTATGTLALPNSNTLTGVANYLQNSQGFSVGGGTTYYFDGSGNINANAGTFAGDVAVNGGDLTTTQTTANLFTNATTLGIGAGSGTSTINNALTVIGAANLNGNTTFGDAITDSLTFTGRVAQDADLLPIGTTGTNDLGSASLPWDNVYANVFTQNGNTVCDTSGNCASVGNYFGQTNGALYPVNNSVDFLIGSNATTSAKFAFTGVTTGTPTASISGTTANVAAYLTGNGNLATTNMTHLTLGGSSTGQVDVNNNLNVSSGNGYLINNASVLNATTLGSSVVNSSLTGVGALASGSIASGFGTIATANTITGTTLNGTTGVNTGAVGGTQRIDSSGNLLNINNVTAAGTVNLAGLTASKVVFTDGSKNLTSTGTIGADQGGTGFGSYAVGDLLYADTTSTLGKLADVATGNVLISGGVNTAPSWGKVTLGTHTSGNYVSTLAGTANQITASGSTGNITLSVPSDFRAPGTVNAVTGIYTGAGAGTIRIDASGNITATDLSSSGNTTLGDAITDNVTFTGRVAQDNDLLPITTTGTNDLGSASLPWDNIYGNVFVQNGNLVCDASGANCPSAGSGGSKWKLVSGAISPFSDSLDVLIGNSATTSAKFAFSNVLAGLPTASIAGDIANVATYLTGNGALSTTNARDLTLGSATTGNVVLNSRGSAALTANGANLTATGTLALPNSNTLTGVANYLQNSQGFSVGGGTTFHFDSSGNLVANDLNVNANTTLGDAITDNITFTGRVAQDADLLPITTTGTNDLGSASLPWDNVYSNNFVQNGNAVCDASGANCPSAGTGGSKWRLGSGAISPFSDSLDVLIGGSATTSAKIAFTNILTGTPTATISGTTANVATYLTGEGNLATTNMNHLTLGGSTTGQVDVNNDLNLASGKAYLINNTSVLNGTTLGSGVVNSSLTSVGTLGSLNVSGTVNLASLTANKVVFTDGSKNLTSTGTVAANQGGTGLSSYAVGDLLYADTTSTLGKLADIATGNVLISGGVNTAPSWGKVTLGTHTTGNYVSTLAGTANQITASGSTGDITLTIPSDFRAPGTVNAVSGIYTGAGAGTIRIDASGNITATDLSSSGNTTLGDAITDTLTFTGRVAQDADLIPIGTTGTNDLGSASLPWDNIYGVAFTQNGNSVCDTSGNCSSVGNYWGQANGALYPANNSVDLLLGSTATASAKFAFKGVANGLPTASISGDIANVATYLTGNGALSTTNARDLTLGSATTGNVVLNSRGSAALTANGANLTTIGTVTLPNTNTLTGVANYLQNSQGLSVGGGTTFHFDSSGNLVANDLNANGNTTLGDAITDTLTFTGRVAQDADLIPIGTTGTNDLGSASLPWDNIYGVAFTQNGNNVCDTSGNCAAVGNYFGQTNGALYPVNSSVDFLIGSNATTSAKFAFRGVSSGTPTASIAGSIANVATYLTGDGSLSTTNARDLALGSSTTGNVILNSRGSAALTANGANLTTIGTITLPNTNTLTGVANYLQNSQGFSVGGGTTYYFDASGNINANGGTFAGDVAVNGGDLTTTQTTANLFTNATTLGIGAGSGTTTINNALAVTGALNANGNVILGDAITDTLTFTGRVAQDADLIPIGTTGTNDLGSASLPWDNIYANVFTQNGNLVCDASGANCPSAGSGGSKWKLLNGAISPFSDSLDVLIGNSATTSAKFAFTNVQTGTPTASIAGTTANVATYLTGEGNLAVTNGAHLTLGGSTTGQIDVSNDLNLANGKAYLINNASVLNATTLGSSVVNSSLTSVGTLGSLNVSGTVNLASLTANKAVFTDGSKNLTSTGTVGADQGGTGLSSYAVGDLLYANTTSTLGKLADVATGNVLISGGVNTAPSWGKVALGTHTTGNYVSTLAGTANQITASGSTGDITLSVPSDFRAPGTVNAVSGIYTGAGAGTIRIDASGNMTATDLNSSGNTTLGDAITDTITFTGRVAQDADLLPIGTTGTNDLGSASLPWDNVYANAFIQNGNAVCDASGANCPAAGSGGSKWKLANGTISPFSDSLDVLIGNSATTSAKFAFTNVLTGTPTASIAGSVANVATYLTGNGALSTTNAQDLILGSATTGNVVLNSRGSAALTANGANLTATGTLTLPNSNTLTGVANYLQNSQGFSVGGGTTYYFDASGNINANGGTFAGDVAVNGGDLTTTQTTANLFTNATILGIGAGSGTTTINNGLTITGALTANGDTTFGNAITDTITFGGRVAQDSDLIPIGTTGTNDLGSASLPWDNIYGVAFTQNGNSVCDTSGNCSSVGNLWQQNNKIVSPANSTYDLAIGGVATGSAFQVFGAETATSGIEKIVSSVTTTGDILSATASAITSGNLLKLGQAGAANFTGNGIFIDADNTGGGSFSGNFLKFNNAGSTQFTVGSTGVITLANAETIDNIVNGSITFGATTLELTGGNTLHSNQTSFDLLNTTTTTLNIGGAATTLVLGAATGTSTINNNLSVKGDATIGDAITDNITFTGRVAADADLIPIGTTGTNDLGSASLPWDNIYGVAFTQNGNSVCDTSGNCSAVGNQWQLNNKIVSPAISSYDLAIGGTATGSAFQVFGLEKSADATSRIAKLNSTVITTGTVFEATASAITSGNIVKLGTGGSNGNFTGNGLYMDFDNTGGNSFTGNFLKFDNATSTKYLVDSSGNVNIAAGSGLDTITAGTLGIGTTTANAVSISKSGVTTTVNGSLTSTQTLTASNGLTLTTGALNLTSTSGTSNLTSTATSGDSFAFTNNVLDTAGANLSKLTFKNNNTAAAGLAVSGVNISATGATPLSGTNTENLINLSATALGSNTFNGINFGNGLSNYVNSANWTVTAAGAETIASDLAVNGGNITTTQTTANIFTNATTLGLGAGSGTTTINNGLAVTGASALNGNVTLGDAITDTLTFTGRVAADADLIPIGTTGTNDLGSASLPWDNIYSNAFIQNGNNVCDSSGAGCPSGSSGGSKWKLANGAISPFSDSLDVLIGNSATTSAKFAFKNVAAGTPTASISGVTANVATYLTGEGNLATTNMAPLTIGGATTGSVQLNPKSSIGLFIDGSGNVGVNTITPTSKLSVVGTSANSTGKAAFLVDQYESQDILTASASGSTKMTLANDGTLSLYNATSSITNTSGDITIDSADELVLGDTDTLIIGGHAGNVAYNVFSNSGGAPGLASIDADNDIYVQGSIEVDGASQFDGTLTATGAFLANGNVTLGDAITDTITFTGRVAQDADLIPIGTTGTNDLGSASLPWDNIYGVAFTQNGNNVCDTSGNCSTVGNYWQLNNKIVSPANSTYDLAVGGTATGSAFQVFGLEKTADATSRIAKLNSTVITTGTVFEATASAITSGNMIKLGEGGNQVFSGYGLFMDFDNTGAGGGGFTGRFLELKNNSTEEFYVDAFGNWAANGNGINTGNLAVNGGNLTTSSSTAALFNTTATTLSLGGAATTALNIGNGAGAYSAINIGSGAGTHTIDIAGTGAVSADTIRIGTGGTAADTITIGSTLASTALALNDDNWNITGAGLANFVSVGAATAGTGAFTTLTSSGASTLGTGSSLTNTFGSGASSINTIGSSTTPGALTLHGATTLDNSFTISGNNTASISGVLTVGNGATNTIQSPYGPLNLAYKSAANTWTTGLTLTDTTGNVVIAQDLAVNGGDLTTSAATATLFNTTATTLSIGGAATTLNLQGAGSATLNIGNATGTTALNLTSGTGAQTFASSVATTTGTSGGFVFTGNALTTGTGMYVNSSSITSGDLLTINSTGTTLTTGNLFRVQNNSSDVFTVGANQITAALPTQFTAAGDVNIAYDLVMTNQTASTIDSYGPLTLRAGESFENNNLTLTTYGTGAIIADRKFSIDSQIALDDSTTPSVTAGNYFLENNSANRLVTNFTNGTAGQMIYIEIGTAANFDLDCTSSSINCGSTDITAMATGDSISLIYDGTQWNLLSWMDQSANNADNTDGVDIAELFPSMETLNAGEIVKVDPANPEHIIKSASAYESQVVGIVSTKPGITLGEEGASGYAVALAGRVPVKISNSSEHIIPGDYITTSGEAGKGVKATSNGRVIGQALEAWDNTMGKSEIIVFVNNTWYEPVQLGDNGDVTGVGIAQDPNNPGYALLTDSEGNVVNKLSGLIGLIADNIQSAYASVTVLATNSFTAIQGTVDNLLVRVGLVSPEILTRDIKPLAGTTDINIKLGTATESGTLAIKNNADEVVAGIDSEGNATFSGEIRAGTIYADQIIARDGKFGDMSTNTLGGITRQQIEDLLTSVEGSQEMLSNVQNWSVNTATASASLNELDLKDLYVTGTAAMTSLSLTESLTLGTDLVISSTVNELNNTTVDSIDTLNNALSLQSSASQPLYIMAGKIQVDTDGNMQVLGNLAVGGVLSASAINIAEDPDATISGTLNGNVLDSLASAGDAKVASASSEIILRNPNIKAGSLIFVTPTSESSQTLYVKTKDVGTATIGVKNPVDVDVTFNWWIVGVAN